MLNKKREKDMVILSFVLSIFVFIIFVVISIYIYKEVIKIEEVKSDFNTVLDEYNSVKTKWLTYEDFTVLTKRKDFDDEQLVKELSDEYTQNLLKNLDKSFYDSNFINSENLTYIKFLENKKNELEESNAKEDFIKKEEQILSILPMYITEWEFHTENGLTDFKFISYIENLLRKYSLTTTSSIGIKEIRPVNNKLNNITELNIEESWIYYIPLNLKLVWAKANILKFLNYINTAWTVLEENWDIVIKDKNQIVDISSLEMNDYIDSSSLKDDRELFELIINWVQSNDRYEVEVQLSFFVVGVPLYKIKQEVEKVIWKASKESYNYYVLENLVQENLKNTLNSWNSYYEKHLSKINLYLWTIKKDVISLYAKINKWENVEKEFKKVLEYKDKFLLITKELSEVSNKLNLK